MLDNNQQQVVSVNKETTVTTVVSFSVCVCVCVVNSPPSNLTIRIVHIYTEKEMSVKSSLYNFQIMIIFRTSDTQLHFVLN